MKHAPVDDGIRRHNRVTEITLAVSDRDVFAFLYSSHRWQRLRAIALSKHPLCDRCGRERTQIIDHIIPAGVAVQQAQASGVYTDKHAGFFLLSNLQGLCRSCHGLKTEEDKAHVGEWPSVLCSEDATKTKRVWAF